MSDQLNLAQAIVLESLDTFVPACIIYADRRLSSAGCLRNCGQRYILFAPIHEDFILAAINKGWLEGYEIRLKPNFNYLRDGALRAPAFAYGGKFRAWRLSDAGRQVLLDFKRQSNPGLAAVAAYLPAAWLE